MNSAAPHEGVMAGDGKDCSLSCDSPASRCLTGVVLRENNADSWWLRIHSRTDSKFYTVECLFDTSLLEPEARSFSQEKDKDRMYLSNHFKGNRKNKKKEQQLTKTINLKQLLKDTHNIIFINIKICIINNIL